MKLPKNQARTLGNLSLVGYEDIFANTVEANAVETSMVETGTVKTSEHIIEIPLSNPPLTRIPSLSCK